MNKSQEPGTKLGDKTFDVCVRERRRGRVEWPLTSWIFWASVLTTVCVVSLPVYHSNTLFQPFKYLLCSSPYVSTNLTTLPYYHTSNVPRGLCIACLSAAPIQIFHIQTSLTLYQCLFWTIIFSHMNFLLFWYSFMHVNFISPIRLWAS